jgi:imidazolonepropionase-like amidohydrolase
MKLPAPILLEGAFLCDGGEPPRSAALLLEEGRIARILPPEAREGLPAGLRRVNLDGYLITPGLLDLHTHLFLPGEESPGTANPGGYERMLIKESLSFRTLRGAANARLMLDQGFTTVRDVCTEGAGYADVALRDAIGAGLCEGPRIFPCGPGLGITGGYLPNVAPGICIPTGCSIVDGADAARREVRAQISHGVSWIKVFADWPCRPALPGEPPRARPTFTREELSVIVEEAGRAGRRVAAHATSDAGARQAIDCGVAP